MSITEARQKRAIHSTVDAMPDPITKLVAAVSAAIPNIVSSVDAPRDPAGEWFVDLAIGDFQTNVAWRPSYGFGLFTSEEGYGDYPNEVFRKAEIAALRIQQLHFQWLNSRRMSPAWLPQLRQLIGIQQAEIATAMSLNQPAISRFENRDDVKISTLNNYVAAIGGRLEMRVHLPDLDVSIDLPSPTTQLI
jgi:hypothetical protein